MTKDANGVDNIEAAAWILRRLGRCLLVAMVVPMILLAVAAVTASVPLFWIAAFIGPPTLAWQLATTESPNR